MSAHTNGRRAGDGALWACAAVLAGLIMVQAARVNDTPAAAGPAIKADAHAMVTVRANNSDVLLVLDDRAETMTVYGTRAGQKFDLLANASLPELFTRGRREFRTAP
jgi:hypothetical protein